MQIRSKLTLQFILIVAIILQISLFFIYFKFKNKIEDEFYNGLKSKAFMTAEMLVNQKEFEPTLDESKLDSNAIEIPSTENFIIYNFDNKKIYEFNQSSDLGIPLEIIKRIKLFGEYRFDHGIYKAIGIYYKNRFNKEYTVISESVFNSTDLQSLRNIIIIDFFIIIIILLASGWFFAGQALQPVTNIMNEIDKILPSDLSKRLPASGSNDELSRLTRTFNSLLQRVEEAFNVQKSFLSNISHELKNPLTVISSQIEVALSRERTNEDYRKTLDSILQDVKDLNIVSDQLMQLSRIKNHISSIEFKKIRLDELLWDTRSVVLKNHPDYLIMIDFEAMPVDSDKLYISGNEQLLKTAFTNLFDNGCKFSDDHQIKVKLTTLENNCLVVEISDHGPGISDDEKQLIFTPFYRSPKSSKIKGSGVGLALVDSVLKVHEASVEILDNIPVGIIFRLSFKSLN